MPIKAATNTRVLKGLEPFFAETENICNPNVCQDYALRSPFMITWPTPGPPPNSIYPQNCHSILNLKIYCFTWTYLPTMKILQFTFLKSKWVFLKSVLIFCEWSVPFKFNTLKTFSRTLPNFLCLFQRSFRSIRSPVRPPRPSQVGFFNRKLSTRQKVIFWTNKLATGLPPATAKSSLYTATLSRQQRECCANIQLSRLRLKLPAKIENSKQTNLSLSSCSASSLVFCSMLLSSIS